MTNKENLLKGLVKENPLFVSVLGMCPSLAVSTSLENALGMGMGVLFVLVMSNLIISLIMSNEKLAALVKPVRIPVYIVVIATLVTIVEMVMHAFLISLYNSLGVFIPLIVVNCIILGRAEAFASSNKPLDSVLDGIGMALGFTAAIAIIAIFREFLGKGTITVWGNLVINLKGAFTFIGIEPIGMFVQPAGAFLSFGLILAAVVAIGNKRKEKLAKGAAK
ncbi:electron transport complex subunit RsxE [Candidatus Izemoplasma sp. B36]|uniref:electron transport complex subunit RsxE n=1 Tax=Candidatus Izemoplasma sp. B36 TaxID=3242468 RepID=UPI003556ED9D